MYQYKALVTRVIDGDTVEMKVDLGFNVTVEETFRLYAIDAYETKLGPGTDAAAKAKGLEAKQFLKDLIEGKEFTIDTFKDKQEKYGRYLVVISINGGTINKIMIDKGYAVEKWDDIKNNKAG